MTDPGEEIDNMPVIGTVYFLKGHPHFFDIPFLFSHYFEIHAYGTLFCRHSASCSQFFPQL